VRLSRGTAVVSVITPMRPDGAAEVLGGHPAASKGAGKIGTVTARCNRAQDGQRIIAPVLTLARNADLPVSP
jgi:hypothetical protein